MAPSPDYEARPGGEWHGGRVPLSGVSLICTVYNEAESIGEFLQSISDMDCIPDEFLVVDGGSTDGTPELIRHWSFDANMQDRVRIIIDGTANRLNTNSPIARGRNLAVQRSRNEIIACTDAGCQVDPEWLGRITSPLLNDPLVDVVGGSYRLDSRSFLEKTISMLWRSPSQEGEEFLPSSRSFAFRRAAWDRVGGYPEISYTAEDTAFVLALKGSGARFAFAFDAVVRWRMRSSISRFAKMFYSYGFGDGYGRIRVSNLVRNATKLIILLSLFLLTFAVHPGFAVPLVVYWLAVPFYGRFKTLLAWDILWRLPFISFVKTLADVSYLLGYLRGRLSHKVNEA